MRLIQHRQHPPGVGVIQQAGGFEFHPGSAGVKDLKRRSVIGLFFNSEIPTHRCTSDPGSTAPLGHPKAKF
jgi:hypothetical protein